MKYRVGVFIVLSVWLVSCGHTDSNRKGKDVASILKKPPYAGLTDSIGRFPDQPELYLQRALLLSQNNLHEVASPDYYKSWQLTSDPGVGLEYASNLLLMNRVDSARNFLESISRQFPEDNDVKRRLGEIYMQTGNTEKATRQYDEILETDPMNFEAWFDKAELALKMGDTTAAIEAMQKSFSVMPISYSGLPLANLYISRKDPKALEICDVLIAQDSTHRQTDALFLKGVYYSETRQYPHSIEQFDSCIARDWKMTDAYIEKGIVYVQQKQFDEALKIFNMAATVSNTDSDAYFWMGRCYEAMNQKDKAIENYQRALALEPNFYEAETRLHNLQGS